MASFDRGASWRRQHVGGEDLLGLCFVSAETGWIVGRAGTIFHTVDGGGTWTAQQPDQCQRDFYAVVFADRCRGWIVGGGRGTFYAPIEETADGGETWQSLPSHVTDSLFDVAWNGADVLCAVGRFGRILRARIAAAGETAACARELGT